MFVPTVQNENFSLKHNVFGAAGVGFAFAVVSTIFSSHM
jgi:hypothetical protein